MPLALVIDDEEATRGLVSEALEKTGCEVLAAANGAQGLDLLRESGPDLVVLDADSDGWSTLEGIRAVSDVPVLMVTPAHTNTDRGPGLSDVADDYIAKPVDADELIERAEALLRGPSARPAPSTDAGSGDVLLPTGSQVGHYRIDGLVAHGGMSSIYRATHTALERPVALKVLSDEMAGEETSRARFATEWKVAAALRHPNILEVYDAGEADGRLFMAMELIEGGDFGALIDREGALAAERALLILEQAASALDAAHSAGIVHRDVKPGNLLLDGDRVLLTDFGLTKILGSSARLTAPGRMVGTASFLSPEQIRNEPVDHRADVYALGCVMFEALTGTSPYEADSDFVLMYAHMSQAVPRVSERRPGLSPVVDDVVTRTMAKPPGDRYPSAGEAVAALREALGL